MPAENPLPTDLVRGDHELSIFRVFDAPRDLVFKVWTDPHHVVQWWGPQGFTNTTYAMNAVPGGVWRFVMHGPDGRDYQNKITYLEVIPNEKLVYQHGGDKDVEPVNFTVTVTFSEVPSGTRVDMRMVFPSKAALEYVVKTYGADKGLVEHITRLGEYLPLVTSNPDTFEILRTFDAPRKLVYEVWTDPAHRAKWFGPKGVPLVKYTDDFRPGGVFHYCLQTPNGQQIWGKWVYREILPPQRLVWVSSFSDAEGNITNHPLSAEPWPKELLTTITFSELEGKTTLLLRWTPIKPTDAELANFRDKLPGMQAGWGGTFEQLIAYLAEIQQ